MPTAQQRFSTPELRVKQTYMTTFCQIQQTNQRQDVAFVRETVTIATNAERFRIWMPE